MDGKHIDLYPALRKCLGPIPLLRASEVGRWERFVPLTFSPAPSVLLPPVVSQGPLPPDTGKKPWGNV